MSGLAALRERLAPLLDRYGDLALALVVATAGLLEALSENAERNPLLTLLVTVPLAWRRRWPLAVMGAAFLGAAISRQAAYVELICAAIAAYSVGAHEPRRWLAGTVLVTIAVAVLVVFGGGLPPLPPFAGPFLILLPLGLVGYSVRQLRARAETLAERAQRVEEEAQLRLAAAHAEERARIARELHDVVAHSVSVMVVQAGAARQVVDLAPGRSSEALRAVEETGRQAMAELRRILGVLGEAEADYEPQPGLAQVPALVATVREAGLPVEVKVTGSSRPLPPVLELTAYRVIQEALTNALKHSGLASTHVGIDYRGRELKLEILCDGALAVRGERTGGRGIAGMKERIALVGGRLEAGPGVEAGYNVRAWLPLDEAT